MFCFVLFCLLFFRIFFEKFLSQCLCIFWGFNLIGFLSRMSSFFNWLCFPNRNMRSKQKTKYLKGPDDDGGFTSVKQKRKISRNSHQTDYIRKQASFHERERSCPKTNESNQPALPNKRRRVQDIFNTTVSEYPDSTSSQVSQKRNSTTYRTHADFGSEYTPKMYYRDVIPSGHVTDSMYGYIPKTVQTCSASKALEGDRVDDFFSNLREENSLHQFGKVPSRNFKHSPLVPRFTFPRSQSQTSLSVVDKISLIESEEAPESLDYCEFAPDITTRVHSMLEASFDSMWNSNGEVLY